MSPPRKRADILLVERGLFESRARARAAIEAGLVTANNKPVVKPSETIAADANLQAQPAHPFVSRGGVKLAAALETYPIEIEDHVCLDVGASTGGFTEVLLANGAAIVFAIDVGREQLHPSLRDHPKVVSMEQTDIRDFEGKRLPARPDIVVIDVSFISLKAVLPVALSLAAAPMHLLALIKPQFEAQRKHSKRGIIRNAMVHQEICDDIAALRPRSDAPRSRYSRRRSRVATATSNSFSARAVVERLVIDRVGHLGDGVGFAGGQMVYVPYTLGGETVEVAPVPGHHPDRRRVLQVERASPERIAPFCPHFGVCGGCAIQHWEAERYRAWKRNIVVETLAQAELDCAVAPLIDAHGLGRRRLTLHARMGTHDVLKVGFTAAHSHDIVPVDRCPILDPHLGGALDAGWAIAEPLIAIGKPLDIQITATDNGLDVDVRGSGPLPAAMIAKLSVIAEQHRLARLTRHGELVLMRRPPALRIGSAQVALPPGSFLQATVAGEETLAALVSEHCGRAKNIADLFCGVGPFALRLAPRARISAFDNDAGANQQKRPDPQNRSAIFFARPQCSLTSAASVSSPATVACRNEPSGRATCADPILSAGGRQPPLAMPHQAVLFGDDG